MARINANRRLEDTELREPSCTRAGSMGLCQSVRIMLNHFRDALLFRANLECAGRFLPGVRSFEEFEGLRNEKPRKLR